MALCKVRTPEARSANRADRHILAATCANRRGKCTGLNVAFGPFKSGELPFQAVLQIHSEVSYNFRSGSVCDTLSVQMLCGGFALRPG